MTISITQSAELAQKVSTFLDASKAIDVVSIDLKNKSSIADYMVVASGTSGRHVKAMAEKLKEFLHKNDVEDVHMEGLTTCDWVLVDAGDIIIHLFRPEIREFYNLEKMWNMDFKKNDPTKNTA